MSSNDIYQNIFRQVIKHVLYVVFGNDEKKKQNGYHANVLKYGMKVIRTRTILLFNQIYDSFIQLMEAEIARFPNLIKIFSCLLKFWIKYFEVQKSTIMKLNVQSIAFKAGENYFIVM